MATRKKRSSGQWPNTVEGAILESEYNFSDGFDFYIDALIETKGRRRKVDVAPAPMAPTFYRLRLTRELLVFIEQKIALLTGLGWVSIAIRDFPDAVSACSDDTSNRRYALQVDASGFCVMPDLPTPPSLSGLGKTVERSDYVHFGHLLAVIAGKHSLGLMWHDSEVLPGLIASNRKVKSLLERMHESFSPGGPAEPGSQITDAKTPTSTDDSGPDQSEWPLVEPPSVPKPHQAGIWYDAGPGEDEAV